MAFIEIGFTTKRPLILGRGGFGTQLNDWLMDEGWGRRGLSGRQRPRRRGRPAGLR